MLIWLFALLLIASVAATGFNFGVIRALFSFAGLIVAAWLAFPLGHFLSPVVSLFDVKNPLYLWVLGPLVMFILVLSLFKLAGYSVFQKIDVFYKYKAGDLRMAMWHRLDRRLGLCVGLANGSLYTILACVPLYVAGYATTQLAGEQAGFTVRTLSALARQIQSSGMYRMLGALNPMPRSYYDTIDAIALIYRNPLAEARLSRYPGFLALGEKPEFQAIAKDTTFAALRHQQASFGEILDHPLVRQILDNPDLLRQIWAVFAPDVADLDVFIRTGRSPKYEGEKILGRWDFDLKGSLLLLRRSRPNLNFVDVQKFQARLQAEYGKTTLVATAEKTAILKNVGTVQPAPRQTKANAPPPPPVIDYANIQGRWDGGTGGKYQLDAGSKGTFEAAVEGDQLSLTGSAENPPMRFNREF